MSDPTEFEKVEPVKLEKMEPVKKEEPKPPESLSDLVKIFAPHFPAMLKTFHTQVVISKVCETIKMICILGFAAGVLYFIYKVHQGGDTNLAEKTIIGLFGFLGGFMAGKKTWD